MENLPPYTKSLEQSATPFDEDDFIPIDPDWKKQYYKRVLNKRIKAYWLDALIVSIILIILIVFAYLDGDEEGENTMYIANLVYPIVVGYMESSKWKGFIGKRIMKIEVSDNYGNPISFWRSIWRNFLKGITFYICLTIVGYFIQKHYYLKTGKLIHDYWSNTVIGERLGN